MARSKPRPLWGWSAPVCCWVNAAGSAVALAMVTAGVMEAPESRRGVPAVSRDAEPLLVIDPNTASPALLATLPRLGPALIDRILIARDRVPFSSVDDLGARVKGIGPATLEPLRPLLRVANPVSGPILDMRSTEAAGARHPRAI